MIDSNRCRCGHTRVQHAKKNAGCSGSTDCTCKGFIRDERAGWLPFVRAAEMVLRERAESFDVVMLPGSTPRVWTFTLRTIHDDDLAAPPGTDTEELAELTGSRWLDESARVKGQHSATLLVAEQSECPTCTVDVGEPCQPVHNGERGAGGWSHPARGTSTKPESEIVKWAHRVKRGDQQEVWPGVKGTANFKGSRDEEIVRVAVGRVVDEIIALAHINACLMAAGGAMAIANDERGRVIQWAHRAGADYGGVVRDPEWPGLTHANIAATIRSLSSELRVADKKWKAQLDERARSAHQQQGGAVPEQQMRRYGSETYQAGDEVESVNVTTVRRRRPGRARFGYVTRVGPSPEIVWITQNVGVPDESTNEVGDARQRCGRCSGTGVSTIIAPAWMDLTGNLPCECRAGDVATFRSRDGRRTMQGTLAKEMWVLGKARAVYRTRSMQQQPAPLMNQSAPPPTDERSALEQLAPTPGAPPVVTVNCRCVLGPTVILPSPPDTYDDL